MPVNISVAPKRRQAGHPEASPSCGTNVRPARRDDAPHAALGGGGGGGGGGGERLHREEAASDAEPSPRRSRQASHRRGEERDQGEREHAYQPDRQRQEPPDAPGGRPFLDQDVEERENDAAATPA